MGELYGAELREEDEKEIEGTGVVGQGKWLQLAGEEDGGDCRPRRWV